MPPERLAELTHSAALGTGLIPDHGLSYRYLLPNKLFEYIQARVPVVVSDFPELRAVVQKYDIGLSVNPADSAAIAAALSRVRSRCRESGYREQLERAARELTWERESLKFLKIVEGACASAS